MKTKVLALPTLYFAVRGRIRSIRDVGLRAWFQRTSRALRYRLFGAPDGLPIPPKELYALVSSSEDLDLYFVIGRRSAQWVRDLLGVRSVQLDALGPVLDFGCGCGRTLRHFQEARRLPWYGTDINVQQISWCRANLPFARFGVNGPTPPLTFDDAYFGLVYAFSVFTHLPESLQFSWMQELHRVLRPGGYLVMSLHGALQAHMLPEAAREQFALGLPVVLSPEAANIPEFYARCGAFHLMVYVKEKLARGFELVEFVEGGIGQDIYLLRKHFA